MILTALPICALYCCTLWFGCWLIWFNSVDLLVLLIMIICNCLLAWWLYVVCVDLFCLLFCYASYVLFAVVVADLCGLLYVVLWELRL